MLRLYYTTSSVHQSPYYYYYPLSIMSFWKRLGSNKPLDNLPDSSNEATTIKTDSASPPQPQAAATEQSAAVGPPPIATAYTHPTPPRASSQKSPPKERAVSSPPTFHIFELKQETAVSHNDAMEDKESGSAADNNDNDSTHSTDEGTDQNHNPGETLDTKAEEHVYRYPAR